jgi:hypothetical protein
MKKMIYIIVVAAVFSALAITASADIPRVISYQGVLTDETGQVVADGSYQLTFRLYTVPTGGSAQWSEVQDVDITEGLFTVMPGSVSPLSISFHTDYYLGITVESEDELSPRVQLCSSPYAMTSDMLYGTTNMVPSTGNVGFGTLSPDELLDVAGGVKIGNSTGSNAGTIRWTGSDFEGYNGSAWESLTGSGGGSLPSGIGGNTLRHNGTVWTAAGNLYNDGTNVGIGTTSPSTELDVDGDIHASGLMRGTTAALGSGSMPGELTVERFGSAMLSTGSDGFGSYLRMYDDAGEYTFSLMADSDGEGGYFGVYGGSHSGVPEIMMDGNYDGSGNPYFKLSGSRTITFNTDLSGDDCVQLPYSTVSSLETGEEPGVTTSTDGVTTVDFPYRSWTVIDAVTITAPADGYVMVIATCQGKCEHTNATTSTGYYGVSDSPSAPPANQDIKWSLSYAAPSGFYDTPLTVQSAFTPTEGANTYYFLGYEYEGDYSAVNIQLTALFIPTSYGGLSVVPLSAVPGEESGSVPGRSQSYISSEMADAESADRDRVEQELARMREKFRKLEEKVERIYRGQSE